MKIEKRSELYVEFYSFFTVCEVKTTDFNNNHDFSVYWILVTAKIMSTEKYAVN